MAISFCSAVDEPRLFVYVFLQLGKMIRLLSPLQSKNRGFRDQVGTAEDLRPGDEEMPEGSAVDDCVIGGAGDEDAVSELGDLHCHQRLQNSFEIGDVVCWDVPLQLTYYLKWKESTLYFST